MKVIAKSILSRVLRNEAGQSLVIVALTMTTFIAIGGVAVESGHAYLAYQKLVASTNAAALAGAQAMPDTTTASVNAHAYSSEAGKKNATPMLTNVAATPSYLCLSDVNTKLNVGCMTATGGSGGSNAIRVTQTADVPSWFAGLLGLNTFHLSATSTAAMRGGTASTWNIAIIIDATPSMSSADGGAQCSGTRISCALQGAQILLGLLYPCQLGQTCTNSDSTFVDDVSLYVFPPVTYGTKGKDYCSGGVGGTPTFEYYMLPTLPTTVPAASTDWTYQIVPYSKDYKVTDAATGLNTISDFVKATGYTGTSCSGLQARPSAGTGVTYFAQVIYQAQADLIAQQNLHPGSKNAIIFLSDGDATASVDGSCTSGTYKYSSTTKSGKTTYRYFCPTSQLQPSATDALNGVPIHNPTLPDYPSYVGQCGQAVLASKAAADAGTVVFTIGYGATTSGCSPDRYYSASVTTGGGTWGPNKGPCKALAAMASQPSNFYSDNGNGCKATVPSNASLTTLTAIFRQITASLTTPRLVPNGLT